MRSQVMCACPHHVSSDFRNISAGVKWWVRRLKGMGNDKDHSELMVSKFQCHIEVGLFHLWGSLLDRKRNELNVTTFYPLQRLRAG